MLMYLIVLAALNNLNVLFLSANDVVRIGICIDVIKIETNGTNKMMRRARSTVSRVMKIPSERLAVSTFSVLC